MSTLSDWFSISTTALIAIPLSSLAFYAAVIGFTRLSGLRSLSKMSSFDFVMTVGLGSLLASAIVSKDPALLPALLAMAMLFVMQLVVSKLRERTRWMTHLVDNDPLLLMREGSFLEENMRHARVTRHDIIAKLREANVLHLGQVRAVVLETTGDISVLHGEQDGPALSEVLLEGVRRVAGESAEGASAPTLGVPLQQPKF